MQAAFQLGNVADGVLPSAFLVGLLVASVVFSELTRHYNAFRMIGALLRCMRFARYHLLLHALPSDNQDRASSNFTNELCLSMVKQVIGASYCTNCC